MQANDGSNKIEDLNHVFDQHGSCWFHRQPNGHTNLPRIKRLPKMIRIQFLVGISTVHDKWKEHVH